MLCFGSVRPQVISRHGVFCLHVSLHASLSVSDDTIIRLIIPNNDSFTLPELYHNYTYSCIVLIELLIVYLLDSAP